MSGRSSAPRIETGDIVAEVEHCIAAGDVVKLTAICENLDSVEPKRRRRAMLEICRGDDAVAIPLLAKSLARGFGDDPADDVWRAFLSIADASARERDGALWRAMESGDDAALAIVDALISRGTARLFSLVNRALESGTVRLRSHTKRRLADAGKRVLPFIVGNLSSANDELVLHTLNVLGDLGSPIAVEPIKRALARGVADPNVRFAAYEALGMLPRVATSFLALAEGLSDPVLHVAIAAARAIERDFDAVLEAGVRNLVRTSGEELARYVEVIIVAEADALFSSLVEDTRFMDAAVRWFATRSPKSVIRHFRALLESRGKSADVGRIDAILRTMVDEGRRTVWAVDDSKTILRIYESTLHALGYEARVFQDPMHAIEAFATGRPDLLITDLNMPGLTGIDFVRRVRALHPRERLPILMITTEGDDADLVRACEGGIDGLLAKPFTTSALGNAVEALATPNA